MIKYIGLQAAIIILHFFFLCKPKLFGYLL